MPPPPLPTARTLRKLAETDITYEVRQYCRWAFEGPVLTGPDETLLESMVQALFTGGATSMRTW